jgi:7,8-dihydropterin-6-yl-methyl-4-(beta-D-ribofuranosyl)aminobenzene 5'-phosphate synthase
MKIAVLVDNNTLIDQYYFGEPALSFWIEIDGKNILFDVGYSDIFIKNAQKMRIDLKKTNFIVLSHGHLDHTWGLEPLIEFLGKSTRKIKIVAHPEVFDRKVFKKEEIGTRKRKNEIAKYFKLELHKEAYWITKNLCFLGEIPRENDFEGKNPIGFIIKGVKKFPDYLKDDSALVYKSKKGLVIITGCSHSGICNIIAYARKICIEKKVKDIIGGLHLYNAKKEVLEKTANYLKSCGIEELHPCHCTGLKGKLFLGKFLPIKEVGSGLMLEYGT